MSSAGNLTIAGAHQQGAGCLLPPMAPPSRPHQGDLDKEAVENGTGKTIPVI